MPVSLQNHVADICKQQICSVEALYVFIDQHAATGTIFINISKLIHGMGFAIQ